MLFCFLIVLLNTNKICEGNPDAKRLYDDLINGYNNIIRPVVNNSDRLVVKMGLRLSQLIDVNLKNQIMTTNVWVEQEWIDYKLKWEPEEYGGVTKLHVPSEQIWLPDLVLYNNADGAYEIQILTKAILHSDGLVVWKPPAIYKSSCEIDVEFFPFDEQTCFMKFGTWTHDGYTIDLQHIHGKDEDPVVEMGIDLSAFYLSVEWDIIAAPARRKVIFYSCCETPYIDITFNLTLRRKTLFYTFNLIIPCVLISFLSILVFYLPSDSGEKVSLSISIMLSLVVFFLLLAEIIPPTSLTVPLLGRYLLFTMILITLSSVATIAVLNVNFRSPSTHVMAPWVKRLFIQILPKYLCMQRTQIGNEDQDDINDEGDDDNNGDALENDRIARSSNHHSGLYHANVYTYENYFGNKIPNDDYDVNNQQLVRRNSFNSLDSNDLFSMSDGDKYLNEHKPFSSARTNRIESILIESSILPPHLDDNFNSLMNSNQQNSDESKQDEDVVLVNDDDVMISNQNGNTQTEYDFTPFGSNLKRLTTRIQFLSQHKKNLDKYLQIEDDWKFVAMVLDRLFLWVFTISCIVGAAVIILRAPSLYSFKQPIDVLYSKVGNH
ncbi:Acetylcholine receptor subunit alpha-like 1 [Sarcoptes scabiei]|uniref:Acetylcholine receptor subunit alpha-like 1 n=1 Tax=Sarcoptes scabiei TaxID=52283 RepID=A0A834VD40_SARSC|nr:Acetylcholine receptor subunit alpha-like 1 [Sarcoptes scabiei]